MPTQIHTWWQLLDRWHDDALEFVRVHVPKILAIIIVAFILIKLLRIVTHRLATFTGTQEVRSARTQQLRTLASVIQGVGVFVILFLSISAVLLDVNINIGPLLASAGVVGLAIGFGAQTLVKDVINGFFILMENQYDVGDVVKIAGVAGSVERLTLRRTVLRDADGSLHTIPNSEIKIVSNLTRDWTQTAMHVAVSYQENTDRVIGLLKEIGTELRNDVEYADLLVADPEVPGIERLAPGEADYLVLLKTKPGAQYAVTRAMRRKIKECFEKNNIQPAGPAQMYVLSQSPKQ